MNVHFLRAACAACCIAGLPAPSAIAAESAAPPQSAAAKTARNYEAASTSAARDGRLSPREVAALRDSFRMDDHARAMYNALTSTDMTQLVLNRDIIRSHNDLFSNKIKTGPVTNQNHSGRCWLFASLNVMRPDVMQRHKLGKLELSENYIAFWDKLEKANCFLEDVIETAGLDPMDRDVQNLFTECCQDGGDWDYVVALTKKYGEVPLDAMPETHNSANSAQMNHVLRGAMRTAGVRLRAMKRDGKPAAELRDAKEKALADAYRILVMNLGEPPAKFTWRYEDKDGKLSPAKSYTPKSFWKEWVAETGLDDYVTLGNVPGQDYGKLYEISHSRDIYGEPDCRYLNVPIEAVKAAALKSVLDKQPVWFASDVMKDQDKDHGIMEVGVHDYASVFGAPDTLNKAERWSFWDSTPNHAMVMMGVDLADGKPVKWLVENSWGKEKGHDGYWSMYDNWFNEHLFQIVVRKKYVPEKLLKEFAQKPVVLPRWHPMSTMSD